MLIGLISDTHGLLRPEALQALGGVSRIIHGGDIGGPEILEELGRIAPVDAVRGNNDHGPWAQALPLSVTLGLEGAWVHVLHDLKQFTLDPTEAGISVVIAGHSHRPEVVARDGVLYVNPGSAGPRRFRLPVTVALLELEMGRMRAKIQQLL